MTTTLVDTTRTHFSETVARGNAPYPFVPRHVDEAERWALRILSDRAAADEDVVVLSVWLHEIGLALGDVAHDHAVTSEVETRPYLDSEGVPADRIEKMAHCVRAHRCNDVQPGSPEARVLAAADSAAHLTDINYIVMASEASSVAALEKLERDFRDLSLVTGLQEQLGPIYQAWKQLLRPLGNLKDPPGGCDPHPEAHP